MISSSANQMEHSQGRSLILRSRARGRICLKRCSNVEESFNFLAILFPVRPLNQEDFPNVQRFSIPFGDRKSCFREGDCKFTFGWETKTFYKQLAKNNYRTGNSTFCTALRKKCPYSELFWSVFSRIRTE